MNFEPFLAGLFSGGLAVFAFMHRLHQQELWRLKHEYLVYREEFQHLKLESVIVEPLREFKRPDFIAPLRDPFAAVINGKIYRVGDRITDNLELSYMEDHGAYTSPYGYFDVDQNPPSVTCGGHTFYNASLADEWIITLSCYAGWKKVRDEDNPACEFRLSTDRAFYENGADASLGKLDARLPDGRQIQLPRRLR